MPPSLSERTWQAFQAATETVGPTPGLRARWHAGRPDHAVWMVRIDDPVLQARAAALQRALSPWLDPVPLDSLHVTLRVAGFHQPRPHPDPAFPMVDHVQPGTLAAGLGALGRGQPHLLVGGANSFASAAFLEVHDPHGALAALRLRVLPAGPAEAREGPWLPHLTVGTWRAALPASAPAACLRHHRMWTPRAPRRATAGLATFDTETGHIRSFRTP